MRIAGVSRFLAAGALAVSVGAAASTSLPVARAAVPGTVVPVTGPGFDTCAAPSDAQMNDWWTNSPYYSIGIYIGGSNRACTQSSLTTNWADYNMSGTNYRGSAWGVFNFWVGPQAPCTTVNTSSRFSLNISTATSQGESEARSAVNAAVNLGFPRYDTPIYYDLEPFDTSNSSCVAAVKAFINGWDYELDHPLINWSGVYGSSCASDMIAFPYISNVPDLVDLADYGPFYGSNKTAYNIRCVGNTYWSNNMRIHQWAGNVSKTYGSTNLMIDQDCTDVRMNRIASLSVSCSVP